MPILDALLAFAVTMLLVSVVVSACVRLLHQVLGKHANGLKRMLAEFKEQELMPVLETEIARLKKEVGAAADSLLSDANALGQTALYSEKDLKKLKSIATSEFIEQIRRSAFGRRLLETAGDKSQEVFDAIARRYEAVGDRFTASFRQQSQLYSTLIALVIALVVNIDSVQILDAFLHDPVARETAIAKLDAASSAYAATSESEVGNTESAVELGAAREALQQTKEQLELLRGSGLPLGWDRFPHACWWAPNGSVCSTKSNALGWLTWVIGILATAGLAGLGTPFWYDLVGGLARSFRRPRPESPSR